VLAAPFATRAAGAAACPGARLASPNWLIIEAPRFKAGPQRLSAYAVDPTDPDRFLATNGTALMLTTDRGCTWRGSYRLPELPSLDSPFTADNALITNVAFPERSSGSTYATVEERTASTRRPHVLASRDRGRSWRLADVGLPAAGAPETLVIAPSAPDVVFLGVDVGGGALDLLFASTDGARSWTLRSSAAELRPKNVEGLAVDPLDPEVLWVWGPGGLYRSANGGRDLTALEEFAGQAVGPVDVFHGAGAKSRVVAFVPDMGAALLSYDGGRTWNLVFSPPSPDSLAHGNAADQIALAASGRLYGYHAPSFSWIDLKAPLGGLVQARADRQPQPHLYARNENAIVTFQGEIGGPPPGIEKLLRDVPLIQTPEIPEAESPRLTPERRRVVVGLGESRRVRYTLSLPNRPVPVDVFFVLDTSDSMEGLVSGMTRAVARIVNGLAESRVDAQFGLAEFRDYPNAFPPREEEPNFVYRRRLDIGATGPQLREVLQSLDAEGGGPYNAHLGGLYQAATGEGQDLDPPGPLGRDVPPGQQANFRAKALRVLMMASDDEFWRGKHVGLGPEVREPPDVPSQERVENALTARDIRQLGLAIGSLPASDLAGVASATGATAPGGGVDCDGNGTTDLAAGEPLVCRVSPRNVAAGGHMSAAIVDLVKAVRTTNDVSLSVSGDRAVVSRVEPRTYKRVVVQTTPRLTFDVTYHCGARDAGDRFEVDLLARAGFRRANASTLVVCRERPVFNAPLAVLPPLAATVVPPPPPPPPVVPELASQAQSQAQAHAHAQAAAAAQEEEQPQVAAAHVFRAGLEEQYAFSSYRPPAGEAPMGRLALGAGALAIAFAYAVATAARQAVRVQRARR
ncbi:MAG: hypothetical protein ACRDJJ_08295, partial [Actinomycetota bacterium]